MPAKKREAAPPVSGDALIDTIFLIVVDSIKKHVKAIRMKRKLKHPDTNQALYGLLIRDENAIYIEKPVRHSKKERDMILSTLIHEVLHLVMQSSFENRIRRLEKVLMTRLTDEQKKYLRDFLPKHIVKKEPD